MHVGWQRKPTNPDKSSNLGGHFLQQTNWMKPTHTMLALQSMATYSQ